MKKNLLVAGSAFLFLLNACKEIGPAIDLNPKQAGEYDTSYTEVPQTPHPKRVLVEEYTGVQCPNCPEGATILKNYANAHPDKVVIVALHAGALTAPVPGKSKYNFSNAQAQDMMNSYFGEVPPKPAAAFNRVKVNKEYFVLDRGMWHSIMDQRSAGDAPLNIALTSRYDSVSQEVIIKVKLSYTASVTKKQSLSVWILEDGIVDLQINGQQEIPNYVHNHVFRDFVTPIIGASFLDNEVTKNPGRVYERQFIYKPKFFNDPTLDKWNLDNCKVVAFVHNNEQGDKEVAQAVEVNLK